MSFSPVTADDPDTGLVYDSIIWRGRFMVEVSFTEERDRGDGCCIVKTVVMDSRKLPVEYRELIEALTAFVDASLVVVRNPPQKITARDDD